MTEGAPVASGTLTPLPDTPTILPESDSSAFRHDAVTRGATSPGTAAPSSNAGRPLSAAFDALRGATGPLAPGQPFGTRYYIVRLLGIGGMGAVYQAWDEELGVTIALKVIRPEVLADPQNAADLERRFKRELLLARQVTHRNVVRIHDLGEIEGIKYFTMPYVQGSNLLTILRRDGRLSVRRALGIAREIAAGLAAAHEAGIVHRDLKPANIMIDADSHAQIMDFGIARSVAGGGTMAGVVVGTLEYMAPEQAAGGEVDHRADIYAFGLILYDMLVGTRDPVRAESAVAELIKRMQHAPPPLRTVDASIPEPIDALVSLCTDPDPHRRFATTKDLTDALDALSLDGHATSASARLTPLPAPPSPTAQVMLPGTAAGAPVVVPARAMPWKWVAVASGLVALGSTGVVLRDRLPFRGPPPPPAASVVRHVSSLAVLPFRNASGDPTQDWLGHSLADMMQTDLAQSSSLRSVSAERLDQVLRDLRLSAASSLDAGTVSRLAEFSSANALVAGQFTRAGDQVRIEAALYDRNGQRISVLTAGPVNEAELMSAVHALVKSVQAHLAPTADAKGEFDIASVKSRSESVKALRYYSEGALLTRQGEHLEAARRFEAAIQEDPKFAPAYAKLSQSYLKLGYGERAEEWSRRAVALAETLPPREKYLILANHASVLNDHRKAIEAYEALAKIAPDDPDVNFNLGERYEAIGAFDKARDHYASVVARDPKYADALFALGKVEILTKNYQAALEPLNRALSLTIELEKDQLKGRVLNAIGVVYKRLEKLEDAVRYYNEALALRKRLGDLGGVAGTLTELAEVNERLGKLDESLRLYQEAMGVRRQIGDKRGLGASLNNLGTFYEHRGRYDDALRLYKESLEIQIEVGNEDYEALQLQNIAYIYAVQAKYDEAVNYFERALTLREKLEVPTQVASVLHDLADVAVNLGNYDVALSRYLRALDLARTAGNRQQVAVTSASMGTLFEQQGRLGAALTARAEALKTLEDLREGGEWPAEVKGSYGHTLAAVGRADEGQKYLEQAVSDAQSLQNARLIARMLSLQGDSLLMSNDVKGARAAFAEEAVAAKRSGDRYLAFAAQLDAARPTVRDGRVTAATLGSLTALGRELDLARIRPLAVECGLLLGEALVGTRSYDSAQSKLESALRQAERLGARLMIARSHYLLGETLRLSGKASDATPHYRVTRQTLAEIQKEAGGEDVFRRADLRAMRDLSTRWAP